MTFLNMVIVIVGCIAVGITFGCLITDVHYRYKEMENRIKDK